MFSKVVDLFWETIQQGKILLAVIFGIAIILASPLISYAYIPTKILSLIINSAGSCAGTIMLCWTYHKLTVIHKKENAQEQVNSASLQKQLNETEKEKLAIQLEKERLERMRIDVACVTPMLKLGLVSIDTSMHDFMRKTHRNEDKEEGLIFKDKVKYQDEYIGLINKKFSAQLGIDLNKIKIKMNGNTVLVSGIQSEFQGYLNEDNEWLLREMRKKKIVNGAVASYTIMNNDQRIQDSMIEQEKGFKDRIKLGAEFKAIDLIIHKMAKQFIRIMLAPIKKKIDFIENLDDGRTIVEFIQEQNDSINTQIKQLDNQKSQPGSKI